MDSPAPPIAPPLPITQWLEQWKRGDRSVEQSLISAVYPVLRAAAAGQLRRAGSRATLSATDLAHDAYLRLQRQQCVDWRSRDQFFAIAATVVRRVWIDALRERNAGKRAGGKWMLGLDDAQAAELAQPCDAMDWIALDQALLRLSALDADVARVVELKLFSVLDAERIAEVCGSSVATVGRQWRFAKAWLAKELDAPAIAHAT